MSVYLVRTKDDSKELVGIYSCDLEDLSGIVDECCDPSRCEYIEIGYGGICVSEDAPAVPFTGESDDCPAFFTDATISGSWEEYFYGESEGWKPCPSDVTATAANSN